MDLSGKFRIKEMLTFNDNFEQVWKSAEEMLADENTDSSDKKLLGLIAVFDDDGFIKLMMPIPEDMPKEEIDEAIESGEAELYGDDMIVFEKHPYKVEDGKVMFDTGTRGEILGEAINPWTEIVEENGMIRFFTYHLVKA